MIPKLNPTCDTSEDNNANKINCQNNFSGLLVMRR